jgi:hypothetical protein
LACDYLASLSVKSVWRKFFFLAKSTFGKVRFPKSASFLSSKVLASLAQAGSQNPFCWQSCFFNKQGFCFAGVLNKVYFSFGQQVFESISFWFVKFCFWLIGVLASQVFWLLPKSKLRVKFSQVCGGVFLLQSSLAFCEVA